MPLAWSPPREDHEEREQRALNQLAKVKPPDGIVLPRSLWLPVAYATRLSVHRVKQLARRAVDAGDPRLGWYAAHRERLRRRTRRGPGDMSRAKLANWLHARGLPWAQVARACGYANASSARRMAGRYRARLADGGTLRRGRMAYQRRARGETWPLIARGVGYASDRVAREMARRYAQRAGLSWPVPV